MALKDGVLYVMSGPPDEPVETVKGDRSLGGWSWADLSKSLLREAAPARLRQRHRRVSNLTKQNVLWKHTEETPD